MKTSGLQPTARYYGEPGKVEGRTFLSGWRNPGRQCKTDYRFVVACAAEYWPSVLDNARTSDGASNLLSRNTPCAVTPSPYTWRISLSSTEIFTPLSATP